MLDILDHISAGIDNKSGALNSEALKLRESFFVGRKALFTDSTDSGKRAFDSDLTFRCPIRNTSQLFAWHGKIKMGAQYRIHFAWPKPDPAETIPVDQSICGTGSLRKTGLGIGMPSSSGIAFLDVFSIFRCGGKAKAAAFIL